jgi:long-chain acyl-CoA synthetase
MHAVANWAERKGLPYGGYVDLAGKPEVYALLQECVDQVNADLAQEATLAGSQIRRFLVLHKELDADDDELTRTRKVRRGFVAEKYAPLISALFDGAQHCKIETQVKFEDGRTGVIAADIAIRDVAFVPPPGEQRKAA